MVAENGSGPKKTVFVISPIAKKNEDGIDFTKIFLEEIVKPAAELAGGFATPVRGDEVKAPGSVSAKVVADILRADVCVADLTQLNPNVMYEVAIAHAAGKPCILMKQTERDGTFVPPPFDFIDERTIPYGLLADSANRARDALVEFLRNAHHDEADELLARTMNPVRSAFQHQRTVVEAQPVDKAVLEHLESLTSQVLALSRIVENGRAYSDQLPATRPQGSWSLSADDRALLGLVRELFTNDQSNDVAKTILTFIDASEQGVYLPSPRMQKVIEAADRHLRSPSGTSRKALRFAFEQVAPANASL